MTGLFPRACIIYLSTLALALQSSNVSAQLATASSRGGTTHLTVNDPRAFRGYSLVAPMNSTTTYLVDMDGRVVHTWKSDYTPAMSAYLLDNGHLRRISTQQPMLAQNPDIAGDGDNLLLLLW